jgi:hypothetical protein
MQKIPSKNQKMDIHSSPGSVLEFVKNHPYNEITYRSLKSYFSTYAYPSRKIQDLEAQKVITRISKGFYAISARVSGRDLQKGIVANLLYGPSYISLEYALAEYGLIPERVYSCTSVTSQKNKMFNTAFGDFSYKHLSKELFSLGTQIKKTSDGRSYLIATPEKALLDHMILYRSEKEISSVEDIETYLHDDMRMDLNNLIENISHDFLEELRPFYYRRRRARLLIDYLRQKKLEHS